MIGLRNGIIASSGIIPTSVANLYRWYDASVSSSVTRSGFGAGTVTAWADLSGNGATLTTAGGFEMGYTQAAQNGLNAITGNGSNSYMMNASSTIYGSNYTIITASKSITDGFGDLVGSNDITTGNFLLMNTYLNHVRAHNFMNSGVNAVDSIVSTPTNTNRICGQILNGTSLGVIVKDQIDATLTLVGSVGAPSSVLTIGSRYSGSSGANFSGNIYEILIYTRALTQAELTGIYSYLRNKWAITTT